jgi:signal peptidase I
MQSEEKAEKRYSRAGMAGRLIFWIGILCIAAAVITLLIHPVYRVYGSVMSPTLSEGDVVIADRNSVLKPGDVAALTYNNKLLIRRVIAQEGDEVDVDESGTVTVNGVQLTEPYVKGSAGGRITTDFPLIVPDGTIFVLADNRENGMDSRSDEIGCLPAGSAEGKIRFRIWPLMRFGVVR